MSATGRFFIAALIAATAGGNVFGQTFVKDVSKAGTTAAPFLEIPVGAAAIGMGSAFVSVANDATSLYWNPAGIASLARYDFVAVHTNWIADTKFDFGGVVLPLGELGMVGLSVTSLTMADMMVRTVELPEGTGEFFSASDLAVGVSYGRKLSDRFAVGFTAKYIQESIWHETAVAFALDAGTTFRTDLLGGMTIGASLTNLGTSMRLTGQDGRRFIRLDPAKTGSTDQVPANIEMDAWSLPLVFRLGVSTDVFKNENYRVTVAADALHPSDNFESMNMGAEIAYGETFFLRTGYQSLFLTDAEGGFSFGLGVKEINVAGGLGLGFAYAYRNMGRLDNIHTFSLGVSF